MDKGKPKPKPTPELGFEEALEQVEAIIEQVESGQIGLEQSIAQYERGAALILRCRTILDRAEQKVQELTAQMAAQTSGQAGAKASAEDPDDRSDAGEPPF